MNDCAQPGQPGSEPGDRPRSGGIFQPPREPHGWTGDWYSCPEPDCDYAERAAADGTLGQEYCPVHGAVLERLNSPT